VHFFFFPLKEFVTDKTGGLVGVHRDIFYGSKVNDLKLLLRKFCLERPLNVDTSGGEPDSNMHLLHMALYVLNTTRAVPQESKAPAAHLAAFDLLASCFVPEGPLYWNLVALLLQSHATLVLVLLCV